MMKQIFEKMMTSKIRVLGTCVAVFVLCGLLVGCGNMKVFGLGNFTFNYIHNTITNECYELIEWHDNEMGIEVKTVEYDSLYFSEGTYILVEDVCPICGEH